jgi:D-alanine-D-alanine ligase
LGGAERIFDLVGLPCVIKPVRGGSSIGISIVNKKEELLPALEVAFEIDDEALAERYVKGRELTCGLLERDGELLSLPVTEIMPPAGRFFDYEAKYAPGMSREVTPAEISPALAVKIQALARGAFRACGCRGFARVDFIADPGEPVILEINTIPGMTATSLLPQAAAASGISFPELIGLMLASARHD